MKLLALLSLTVGLFAQVIIRKQTDNISVHIDGKPFTALFIGPEVAKPYFYPLRAASGSIVTRRFPLEDAPGDRRITRSIGVSHSLMRI